MSCRWIRENLWRVESVSGSELDVGRWCRLRPRIFTKKGSSKWVTCMSHIGISQNISTTNYQIKVKKVRLAKIKEIFQGFFSESWWSLSQGGIMSGSITLVNGVYNQKHQPIVERIKNFRKSTQKSIKENVAQHKIPSDPPFGYQISGPKKVCFWWVSARISHPTGGFRYRKHTLNTDLQNANSVVLRLKCQRVRCGVGFGNWVYTCWWMYDMPLVFSTTIKTSKMTWRLDGDWNISSLAHVAEVAVYEPISLVNIQQKI